MHPARTLSCCHTKGKGKSFVASSLIAAPRGMEMLVETHKLLERVVGYLLQEGFQQSHDMRVIEGLTDADKVQEFRFSRLEIVEPQQPEDLVRSGDLVGRGFAEWADETQHSSEKDAWAVHRVPRLLVM